MHRYHFDYLNLYELYSKVITLLLNNFLPALLVLFLWIPDSAVAFSVSQMFADYYFF